MTESDLERILATVARLPSQADVDAVFGKPATVEGRTVIPAAEVTYAFGVGAERSSAGIGLGDAHVSGADEGSASIRSRPIALIEVTPERTTVRPVVDFRRLVPRLLLFAGWSAFWIALAIVKSGRGRD